MKGVADTIEKALSAAGLGQGDAASVERATVVGVVAREAGASAPGAGNARFGPKSSGNPARAGEFTSRSYSNDAGTRGYKLYVPAGYAADGDALPMVVMLHGCTQSPDDFAAGTRMNALADRHGFLVVYPEQAANANGSKCWNWFRPEDQDRGRGEPSLIAGITREVAAGYRVDAGRVFVAGLSAGAAMAVILGATYPELYAAVGAHSGLPYRAAHDMPSAFGAMKGSGAIGRASRQSVTTGTAPRDAGRDVPTIVFHGDRDTVVHPRNADQVILQGAARYHAVAGAQPRVLRQSGRVPDGYAYTQYIHLDPQGRPFQEQWLVHGAGHAWSGGSIRGSYTDPKGPDSSKEMLRFFDANPRLEKKSG